MIRSGPENYDYISLKTRFEASFPENMDVVTPKVPLHLSVCRTIMRYSISHILLALQVWLNFYLIICYPNTHG